MSSGNRSVLVVGGTRGIGLATALAFARTGARCILTHRWGSADEDHLHNLFVQQSSSAPDIVEANAGDEHDTLTTLENVKKNHDSIDSLVCCVSFAQVVHDINDYKKRSFLNSIAYSAWPMVDYTLGVRKVFGQYPRHVIGLSSDGPDRYIPGYDFVAASKAVLETLARYLAQRLQSEGTQINIVRAGLVDTESLRATVGADRVDALRAENPHAFTSADEIAEGIVGLCSGAFKALSGQVIRLDHGRSFEPIDFR